MIRSVSLFVLAAILTTASAQLPPAPVYGTFLNAIELETRPGDVRLKFLPSTFVFLPEREGTIDLMRDGERVAGFTWTSTRGNAPFLVVENVQMQWPAFDPLGFQLTEGGAHELVYTIGDEPFWRFPFEVVEIPSDDPYAPGSSWQLAGPWADHAYMLQDDSQGGTWGFKLWLQTDDFGGDTQYGKVHVTREGSDTPVLVAGGPNYVIPYSSGGWQRFDFQLSRTDGSIGADGSYTGRQSFRASSEPLADGAYTLTFFHNREVYGRYPFTVSGGEIVPTGNQAPGTDAQVRIDGGGAATWLYRKMP
ncbi:MAG: hypothetical protein AAFQ43_05145 [Bacteroidota bacterium]